MQAAQLISYGVVEVKKDVPEPVRKPEDVLVEVFAAGVNPFDWKLRSGMYAKMIPLTLPETMGGDFSGIVKDSGNSHFMKGDAVYGQAHVLSGGSGAFAEFASVKAGRISKKPEKLIHEEAAALPLVGASAIQALDSMQLKKGMRILIHGGAGGIGSLAIQIAKHLGATVATTASGADGSYVRELGADLVIDYTKDAFEEALEDYDAVFDTVGGDTYRKSFRVLKKGGIILSMLEEPNRALMDEHDVTAIRQSTEITTERLARLAALADQKVVSVYIDKVFPLKEAGTALDYLEKSHHRGKVVVKVR